MCNGMGCKNESMSGDCTLSVPQCPDEPEEPEGFDEPDELDEPEPTEQECADAEDRYFGKDW